MLKKQLLMVTVLLLTLSGFSHAYYFDDKALAAGEPFHLVEVPLAVYPEKDNHSEPVAYLTPGDELSVLKYEEFEHLEHLDTLYARCCGWYRVRYAKNGATGEGYVMYPGPRSLDNNGLRFDEVSFRFRLDFSHQETSQGAVTLEAVDQAGNLAQQTFRVFGESRATVEMQALEPRGLQDVDVVIKLRLAPESCAPSYDYYYAWNGRELVFLMSAVQMWDIPPEGNWYAESVVLPVNGAPVGVIAKMFYVATEFNEACEPLDEAFAVALYRWNGTEAVLDRQDPQVTEWRKQGIGVWD